MKFVLALFFSALPLCAQTFEDPGTHYAGWQAVSFVSPPTIQGRVYYPATADGENTPALPGDGYPLVVLIHGQSFAPDDYDLLSLHLASWGHVICSIGPLAGPLHAPPSSAKHARNMLAWMVAESADPTSPFAGLVNEAPFGAMGHSLGGATLEHLIGLEPDVGALVALEPYYDDSDFKTANLDAFEGALLSIGGELDLVVPPALNAYPMAQAASSKGRSTFAEIQDSSHYGATDFPYPGALDPMPWAEQHRIHRKLVTAFLRAELSGEEDALVALLGQAVAHEPIHVESLSFDPPLWVRRSQAPQDDHVLGIAARVGEPAWIAVSPHPASIATRAGVIGLEPATMQVVFAGPLQADGIAEVGFTPPAFLVGTTLHVQGLVLHPTGPILARTASWVVQ